MLKRYFTILLSVMMLSLNILPVYAQEIQEDAKEQTILQHEKALSEVSTKFEARFGPTRYHVWADGLNLRAEPSTSATILEKIYADEWVVDADVPKKIYDDGKYIWLRVKREKTGTTGWVVRDYLDLD